MPNARLAQAADVASLLDLYRAAEVSSSAEPKEKAEQIWLEMLSHESISVFVSAVDAQIVATCMLITAPNLLRSGRQHGFLENVVTHPAFRGQGHGRADPRVHRFTKDAASSRDFAPLTWPSPRDLTPAWAHALWQIDLLACR